MKPRRFVNALRLFWVLVILWGEWGIFRWSYCGWPDDNPWAEYAARVMIVADPQILDMQAYPDRPWSVRLLSQVIVDLNLRRSWRATRSLHPHAVVFLGDMMDRGRRDMPEKEWEAYYRRFTSIFAQTDSAVPTYYLPGNHDVGLGPDDEISPHAQERYKAKFGSAPAALLFGNHTLLLVNAPLLVGEEASFSLQASPELARIRQLARDAPGPIILLSHVPLDRPESTDCGPLRERGTIHVGFGSGYQNLLSPAMSQALIDATHPLMVFSGDDHDYCDSSAGGVRDVSVKSFSMAMGIRRPGYHLLALLPQQTIGPFADSLPFLEKPCFLPDQIGIYLWLYVPSIVLSLLVLALYHMRQRTRGYQKMRQDDEDGSLPTPSLTSRDGGRRLRTWVRLYLADVVAVAWPTILLFGTMAWWSFL